MNKQQILVIEDDAAIRRGVVDALHFDGYTTLDSGCGNEGLSLALGGECDLLLLDLVLPGRDGFAILHAVRDQRANLPVIILTAKGDESDRVRGLRMGADDYVVKPFSVRELLARVHAVLRRAPNRSGDSHELSLVNARIDLGNALIRFDDGKNQDLSPREVRLLTYLASLEGRCATRQELLDFVWGIDPTNIETRTVDMQIARLREKLREEAEPRMLVTVRGRGYRLLTVERQS